MIAPMIHRRLRRDDLARLVAAISRIDPVAASPAARALHRGAVDQLLDLPAALTAVRGNGGPPAPLPMSLLWYVPIRAALVERGFEDIQLADFAATLPVTFVSTRVVRRVDRGQPSLVRWTRAIAALPPNTVARGERSIFCGALALWWAGCFPERVTRRGGPGMIRAYVDFAVAALAQGGALLRGQQVDAEVYVGAARHSDTIRHVLTEVRQDYLGRDAHTARGRIDRWLARLRPATGPSD